MKNGKMQEKPYNFRSSFSDTKQWKNYTTQNVNIAYTSTVSIFTHSHSQSRWHLHNQNNHTIQPKTTCTPIHIQRMIEMWIVCDTNAEYGVHKQVPMRCRNLSSWETTTTTNVTQTQAGRQTYAHIYIYTDIYIVSWTSFHIIGGGNNNKNSIMYARPHASFCHRRTTNNIGTQTFPLDKHTENAF